MTKTEEIKNEVARKYNCAHWDHFTLCYKNDGSYPIAIDEAITLYHKRLLEEAAKELPDINIIQNYIANKVMLPSEPSYAELLKAIEWMKEQASLHLASQKEEIEGWKEKYQEKDRQLLHHIGLVKEREKELSDLKEEYNAIDGATLNYRKEIVQLKEEIERTRYILNNLLNDADEFLRHLEDFTHGKDRDTITELRHRIRKALEILKNNK